MIPGQVLGTGTATTVSGEAVPFVMVKPALPASIPTLGELGLESMRWRKEATALRIKATRREIDRGVVARVQFADEVMAQAAENVRQGIPGTLLAQAQDGRILGAMIYFVDPIKHEGVIALLATEPVHQAGTPGKAQLRGVGTSLVAAAGQDMLVNNITTVFLHPLDAEAASFWTKRGFSPDGPGRLSVRGRPVIEGLLGKCRVEPDCPDDGACVVCGQTQATAKVRLPAARR